MEYAGLPGSTVTVPADFEPLYRRILADIRSKIATGQWPAGHKLPSTQELLEHYRTVLDVRSASTIRQAITLMIETGELRGHQGRGVFVAERDITET